MRGAYYRAFCHACIDRNIEEAAKIIAEEDFEINEVMDDSDYGDVNDETTYLHIAMERNFPEVVKILLENESIKLDIAPEYKNTTALFRACGKHHLECVKLFLNDERCTADIVNMQDYCDETALTWAVRSNGPNIVKILLDFPGIDVNLVNVHGKTALIEAIDRESPELVGMLLGHPKTKLDVTNHQGQSPLFIACENQLFEIVKMLMDDERMEPTMINDQAKCLRNFTSPLNITASNCRGDTENGVKIMRLLLDQPLIDVNTKDHKGFTPLMNAIGKSDDMVKLLLENQTTQLDVVSDDGHSAVSLACEEKSAESLKMFLKDKRWTPELIEFAEGCSPLLIVARNGASDILKILLDQPNIDVNVQNTIGSTPLHLAACWNYPDIVEMLLARKDIEVDILDGNSEYALTYACEGNNIECVKLLLADERCNAKIINNVGNNGRHALSLAVESGYIEIAKMILQQPGVDVNLRNPILLAMDGGHSEIVEMLLENENIEADVMGNNISGLILACIKNHVKCVELILKHEKCRTAAYINHEYTHAYSDNTCALLIAAENNFFEIVRILLKQPETDCNKVSKKGRTLLTYAMVRNQLEILKILLANENIKLDKLDEDENTYLIRACEEESIECVKLFLEDARCSASIVNKKNKYHNTALIIAVKKSNPVMVRLILDFPGTDCNITDEHGFTPLMYAMDPVPEREGVLNDFIIVKLILDKEDTKLDLVDAYNRTILSFKCHCEGIALFTADPRCTPEILNFKNEEGETYLSTAVKNYDNRSERIINILMKHPEVDCNTGNPLAYTMENSMPEVVSLLLANQNLKVDIGTSLIKACLKNLHSCVKLFTADQRCTPEILNMKNEFGETALMTAVAYRSTECVEILAKLSAVDMTIRNNRGKSAMDIANEKFDKTSAKILEKYK